MSKDFAVIPINPEVADETLVNAAKSHVRVVLMVGTKSVLKEWHQPDFFQYCALAEQIHAERLGYA